MFKQASIVIGGLVLIGASVAAQRCLAAQRQRQRPSTEDAMTPKPDDPRIQPGAYVTNGRKLAEVLEAGDRLVALRDCMAVDDDSDVGVFTVTLTLIGNQWKLVQPAPCAANSLESLAAVA